jgi:hypothetical protein
MQSSEPKGSGFFGSMTGQLTLLAAAVIVLLILAWRYVF